MEVLIQLNAREISPGLLVDTVNARDLWSFLESRQEFTNWLWARIDDAGFVAEQDYLLDKVIKQVPHQGGVRNSRVAEYHLTIDAAKHLAMMEKSDKGRAVRNYFIECERIARASATRPVPQSTAPVLDIAALLADPVATAKLIGGFGEEISQRDKTIAEQAPKVQAFDRIATCEIGALPITFAAKTLKVPPRRLFTWLAQNGWIYRTKRKWAAYQEKINQALLREDAWLQHIPGDEDRLRAQVLVTPKGIAHLSKIFCTSSI